VRVESLVGGQEPKSTEESKDNAEAGGQPLQEFDVPRLVVGSHGVVHGKTAVVGLVNTPPLASIASAHCGQIARVTPNDCGVLPAF